MYILNEPDKLNYLPVSTNEKSGIIKIVYGNTSFLFTGDAERNAESFLLDQYGSFLKSDVLKISHHGSNTSSGKNFIDAVKPRYALISDGIGNKFGHPSEKVLERLAGIRIFRTDRNSAVLLRSDGENIYQINWRDFNK
jgi:competence protein ComEC